ncbi:unnamed protein product [Gadus morhua 'NCC']
MTSSAPLVSLRSGPRHSGFQCVPYLSLPGGPQPRAPPFLRPPEWCHWHAHPLGFPALGQEGPFHCPAACQPGPQDLGPAYAPSGLSTVEFSQALTQPSEIQGLFRLPLSGHHMKGEGGEAEEGGG